MIWQLGYASLSGQEANTLTNFFDICQGRLRAFTFIDPAENMLTSSSDFSNESWQNLSSIRLLPNSSDPVGGDAAFVVTNNGQTSEELTADACRAGQLSILFLALRTKRPNCID
jgi:hypothetical protein